ncbi:TPA: hypothetical protein ACX6RS_000433 [Photobacterium damselae]|uniref:hypothetical protein n=1 Tax=Photobacterium damselae TaxID=38293 RepID=UPI001EDD2ED2|nr:hypothetical protein [Photobacterium damselae]MCG3825850.1 hypothetical protein [Photobacterium damselae]
MKKLVFAVCLGMAVFTSSSVFANGGNSGAGGGFGQTICTLPNGSYGFMPWFACKWKGGESLDF